MTPFPKIHDLYLGKVVIGTVLLTWGVLLGLDFMLSLVGEFGDVGEGNYGAVEALAYMAYTVPRRAYTLFPTAAVIGSLMALGQLAATSELTALRAIGLSRRRLSMAVAAALAILTLLMVVNGETLGPWGQRRADALKASSRSDDLIVAQYSGVWAREGDIILNAEGGEERDDGTDKWLELRDVTRTTFAEDSVSRETIAEERWESQLDATALSADIDRPRYLSSAELHDAIRNRQRNALEAGEYEEHYWGRWFYPLNVLALCLAAIPFAFGSLRSGGLGKRLFIGIVFALGFWLVQTQFVKMASAFKFDFRLAYALPTVIMVAVSMFLFKKRSG